jgi:hypothetical protein
MHIYEQKTQNDRQMTDATRSVAAILADYRTSVRILVGSFRLSLSSLFPFLVLGNAVTHLNDLAPEPSANLGRFDLVFILRDSGFSCI